MSSLLEMPKVAMKLIADELDLKSILTLRKVCRDIRHYIDDVQPDSTVKYIRIVVTNASIRVDLGHFYGLFYTRHDDGCELEFAERKIVCGPLISKSLVLNDQNFIEASLKDLEIVFRHQNSVVGNFSLCMRSNRGVLCENFVARPFLEGLKKLLILRQNPLKVQYFCINERQQNDVMSLLPYIHVGSLERIGVFGDGEMFDKKDMIYLDQWNGAKSITVDRWIDDIPAQYFTHLQSGSVKFLTISTNDLIVLKEAFLQNFDFKRFTLNYKRIENEEGLDSFIGPLFEEEHYEYVYRHPLVSAEKKRRKRCFKMENNNIFLEIEQNPNLNQFIFVRLSKLVK